LNKTTSVVWTPIEIFGLFLERPCLPEVAGECLHCQESEPATISTEEPVVCCQVCGAFTGSSPTAVVTRTPYFLNPSSLIDKERWKLHI